CNYLYYTMFSSSLRLRSPANLLSFPTRRSSDLAAVACLAPLWMVAILLAAARIAPGRLKVPPRRGTDPHVGIGRRDCEAADACERARVTDRFASGSEIAKALACALPTNPGLRIRNIDQAALACMPLRADDDLRKLGRARFAGSSVSHR